MTVTGDPSVLNEAISADNNSWEIKQAEILKSNSGRADFYSTDQADEIKVQVGDRTYGVLKVWAPHVIPSLDNPELDTVEANSKWLEDLKDKPFSLFESLEQWRAFSQVSDRRLQKTFAQRELPEDRDARVVELYSRMQAAFTLAAPFYNIEALVDDSREDRAGNPIDFSDTRSSGGKLDVVGLVLPAALRDYVFASQLDWGDASWEKISSAVNSMRVEFFEGKNTVPARQYKILEQVAKLAGTDAESVVFAANALEFIPTDVGGKTENFTQEEALLCVEQLFRTDISEEVTTKSVAKNSNALIRFHNWLPAIKCAENFSGKMWSYDAVCDTAAQLLDLVASSPSEFLNEDTAQVFVSEILPQLQGLDATSAKGRFMLQLLQDGGLRDDLTERIQNDSQNFTDEILNNLSETIRAEAILSITDTNPTYLVGGKAEGLRLAAGVFGSERIVDGVVVSAEFVNSWVQDIPGTEGLLHTIDSGVTVDEKLAAAEQLTELISQSNTVTEITAAIAQRFRGQDKIVLRSSSFDEDVDIIGPAPGVYESVTGIAVSDKLALENAFREVVLSFFSEKAVSYRELKGLRHKPLFAVLAQPYIENIGGSAFLNDETIAISTAPRPSQLNEVDHHDKVEDLVLGINDIDVKSSYLSTTQLEELTYVIKKARELFGPVDIEFVVDPLEGKVRILQMRSLERPHKNAFIDNDQDPSVVNILNISDLPDLSDFPDQHAVQLYVDGSIDLDKFQGPFFRWIVRNNGKLHSLKLGRRIPSTCHFANVVENFGIPIEFAE